jgi:CMP-N-acetylneuraminic acid synthetase
MKTLAVVPARGGSKGIPKKNVVPLVGKPLIHYSIQAALASRYIHRLVVSTDDADIAAVAKNEGAEVVVRPSAISGDLASSEEALLHTLSHLREKDGYNPELLVFLQCTSPLTTHEDIDNIIQKLIDENADSALTVAPFHYYLWKAGEKGDLEAINHDKFYRPMRQQREKQFVETGAVYVMRVNGFLEHKYRFFGKIVMSVMPEDRCFEIDEPVDLVIAEQLLLKRQRNGK